MPSHVASEGLAYGELEAADGAFVGLGFGRRSLGVVGVVGVEAHQPRLLVAGPVAPESLEGGELTVAGLALEDAGRDGGDGIEVPTGKEHQAVGYADALVLPLPHPLDGHWKLDKKKGGGKRKRPAVWKKGKGIKEKEMEKANTG